MTSSSYPQNVRNLHYYRLYLHVCWHKLLHNDPSLHPLTTSSTILLLSKQFLLNYVIWTKIRLSLLSHLPSFTSSFSLFSHCRCRNSSVLNNRGPEVTVSPVNFKEIIKLPFLSHRFMSTFTLPF